MLNVHLLHLHALQLNQASQALCARPLDTPFKREGGLDAHHSHRLDLLWLHLFQLDDVMGTHIQLAG